MGKQFRDQVTDKRKLLNDAARERMIGHLSLLGWVPRFRVGGDMKQLRYVGIEEPDGRLWIETIAGNVDRVSIPHQPGRPVIWQPAQWADISDRLLNAFYLQVNNGQCRDGNR